jgi:hypothetical protein
MANVLDLAGFAIHLSFCLQRFQPLPLFKYSAICSKHIDSTNLSSLMANVLDLAGFAIHLSFCLQRFQPLPLFKYSAICSNIKSTKPTHLLWCSYACSCSGKLIHDSGKISSGMAIGCRNAFGKCQSAENALS